MFTLLSLFSLDVSILLSFFQRKPLSPEARADYEKNYAMVMEAIGSTLRDGRVTQETYELLWKARDHARLYLNKKIADYTEKLSQLARESYLISRSLVNSNLTKEVRIKKVNECCKYADQIMDEKPYITYSKFMRL